MMTEAQLIALDARNQIAQRVRILHEQRITGAMYNAELLVRLRAALPDHALRRYSRPNLVDSASQGDNVRVTEDDLPALRREFGRCADVGDYEVNDAERNTVCVYLDLGLTPPKDVYSVYISKVYYIKELPKDAPCKIHSETLVNHSVVCNVR